MPPQQALKIAEERGLDLVEVAPTATPPVCRIMDYGKYLYQMNKKLHEAKKHQKNITVKEVKFRPNTDEHDYEFKKNHIIRFLKQGDKVKASVFFRGREIVHQGIGRALLDRLVEEVAEVGSVEARPKLEGPNLIAIFAPKKQLRINFRYEAETGNTQGRSKALQGNWNRKNKTPARVCASHLDEEISGKKAPSG